jgi:hypothetical protein
VHLRKLFKVNHITHSEGGQLCSYDSSVIVLKLDEEDSSSVGRKDLQWSEEDLGVPHH